MLEITIAVEARVPALENAPAPPLSTRRVLAQETATAHVRTVRFVA